MMPGTKFFVVYTFDNSVRDWRIDGIFSRFEDASEIKEMKSDHSTMAIVESTWEGVTTSLIKERLLPFVGILNTNGHRLSVNITIG